jgi:hypothetical protein
MHRYLLALLLALPMAMAVAPRAGELSPEEGIAQGGAGDDGASPAAMPS